MQGALLFMHLARQGQSFATSSRHPHPSGRSRPSLVMPAASHMRIAVSRTAMASSVVAPLFSAPFK